MRRLCSRCLLVCVVSPLLGWLSKWAVRSGTIDHYGAIGLSTATSSDAHTGEFVSLTKQALGLVERTDRRRYRTIQRHLRYIVNTPLPVAAAYDRGGWCEVDIERYIGEPGTPDEEWRVARLACTLVHEAAHGRLHACGVRTSERNWIRVERLCHREAARFAARLQSDRCAFSDLIAPFDADAYRSLRSMSPSERVRAVVARWHEIAAHTKQRHAAHPEPEDGKR